MAGNYNIVSIFVLFFGQLVGPISVSDGKSADVFTEFQMTEQPVRLMTLPEVIERVGLQKSWLYSAIAAGNFPAPLKSISARRTLFSSKDIEAWLAEKTAHRAPM